MGELEGQIKSPVEVSSKELGYQGPRMTSGSMDINLLFI